MDTFRCNICSDDMITYYKNFNIFIYYCKTCCHFNANILNNNHNTDIFNNIYDYKNVISSDDFNTYYYNKNSYIILNINDIKKLIKYSNNDFEITIYFVCESVCNLQYQTKGFYDFFSTNSIKYYCAGYNLFLTNVYIIKNTNKTIYEISSKSKNLNIISNIIYNEIINGLYHYE